MVLALSLWAPVLRIARAHCRNSGWALPLPVSRSCWTSRWERVSRLPLGEMEALIRLRMGMGFLACTLCSRGVMGKLGRPWQARGRHAGLLKRRASVDAAAVAGQSRALRKA